jgi:hypothetical protein
MSVGGVHRLTVGNLGDAPSTEQQTSDHDQIAALSASIGSKNACNVEFKII